MNWRWLTFDKLTLDELYALLRLRQEIFMLEQNSLYLDLDGQDEQCLHLCGYRGSGDQSELVAYLRLVPPGISHSFPSLGRILVAPHWRKQGLGRELIRQGLAGCKQHYPGQTVKISAQVHLKAFYQDFGFVSSGTPYDDGGVMHVDMLLNQH